MAAKQRTVGKIFKFLVGGGVAAAFNLVLMVWLIEHLGFDTPLLRNLANLIAIELSLLLSFFIYRIWVWPGGVWTVHAVLFRQIPLYHLSAGSAVVLRVFLLFPFLDWLGVNYGFNTLLGVLLSASLNYLISDRLVFKPSRSSGASDPSGLYYPEGLEPSRSEDNDTFLPAQDPQGNRILTECSY